MQDAARPTMESKPKSNQQDKGFLRAFFWQDLTVGSVCHTFRSSNMALQFTPSLTSRMLGK